VQLSREGCWSDQADGHEGGDTEVPTARAHSGGGLDPVPQREQKDNGSPSSEFALQRPLTTAPPCLHASATCMTTGDRFLPAAQRVINTVDHPLRSPSLP
jgi:hypothetical protein